MTAGPDARAIKADLIRTYDASATARDERGGPDWRDDHRRAFATALAEEGRTCILDFADGWFDAIWAMSCLMHATDEDLTAAIDEMARVLAADGLVTAGMWGGDGTAEVLADDVIEPPRFFAWRTDDHVRAAFGTAFIIEAFEITDGPPDDPRDEHYQLVMMRKR